MIVTDYFDRVTEAAEFFAGEASAAARSGSSWGRGSVRLPNRWPIVRLRLQRDSALARVERHRPCRAAGGRHREWPPGPRAFGPRALLRGA